MKKESIRRLAIPWVRGWTHPFSILHDLISLKFAVIGNVINEGDGHPSYCGHAYCRLQVGGLTEWLQCWWRYSELGEEVLEAIEVSFSKMWIKGELEEFPTVVWRQTSSRSRSTVPARLETFIRGTALETQFCEPRNLLSREIEFLEIPRLDRLDNLARRAVTIIGRDNNCIQIS